MRAALAILLLCLLSHQLLLKLGIVAWYEWNKDYVAQNLCVNRDKPQLKCCGKCYLRKQLAKADVSSKAGKPLAARLSAGELSPFVLPNAFYLMPRAFGQSRSQIAYNAPFAEEVMLVIIHPPG